MQQPKCEYSRYVSVSSIYDLHSRHRQTKRGVSCTDNLQVKFHTQKYTVFLFRKGKEKKRRGERGGGVE